MTTERKLPAEVHKPGRPAAVPRMPAPRQEARGGDMTTGQRLVEAATALLDRGGEAAVTLRAVAHAVGVSHNTPYRHFADRDALLAGVATRDFETLAAAFDEIDLSTRTPIGKVKVALEAFITYGEAHPARYRLLFSDPAIAAAGGRLQAMAMRTFAALARLVAGAQAAGQLPALPTATLTGLIYATVHGLLDLRAGGRMREEKGFSSVVDGVSLLLEIISPPAAKRRPSRH